ncbi:hypothetical protein Pd630_LPD13085 (plasmid) [Rhodococcus opacus PD630]|nr:hypothetical protein Pd630_LPD13085 [Rhodococcus opacus PD630]
MQWMLTARGGELISMCVLVAESVRVQRERTRPAPPGHGTLCACCTCGS